MDKLELVGNLDVGNVRAHHAQMRDMLANLADGTHIEAELDALAHVDGAGLQLLLCLWHAAAERGCNVDLREPSADLLHWLDRLHLADRFGLPGRDAAHGAQGEEEGEGALADAWHLSLRCNLDAFRHGCDPLAMLERLAATAEEIRMAVVDDCLPPLGLLNPHSCHLGFEVSLRTTATRAAIEAIFDDARFDCTMRLLPPTRRAADLASLVQNSPQEGRLGDILVECGAISREALDAALARQAGHGHAIPPQGERRAVKSLGQMLVERSALAPAQLDAALEKQAQLRAPAMRVRMAEYEAALSLAAELRGLLERSASQRPDAQAEAALALARQLAGQLEKLPAFGPPAA